MNRTINAYYWAKNGAVLIPGIGYCFPDKNCKNGKPKDGYILVKNVTVVDKPEKKFGFYTWEPTTYLDPTEKELIAAYLMDPRPQYLSSPVERMTLPNGIAIVLRWKEHTFRGGYVIHGISLNGWAPGDVSFAGATEQDATPYPVEPMFRDDSTMLDLMIQHGYGKVTEAEIFAALRQANADNLIIPASLEDYSGWIEQTENLTVIHGGNNYNRIPVLRGIKPQRDIVIPDKYNRGAKRRALDSFIWNYVINNYHISVDQMGIPYSHFDNLTQEKLTQEEKAELPAAVRKYVDKGYLIANIMYPDYWVMSSNSFIRLCLDAEESELKEILTFCHTEWNRTHPEYKKRCPAAKNIKSLGFRKIWGETEGTKTYSENLEQLYKCRGCEIKKWGNFEYIPSVDRDKLILNFTAEEIEALADEINRLNANAEQHVRTAIAKHKLPVQDVIMRK